ncbi:MAG: hypothetical protein ABI333_11835 [bacterium]
MSRDSRDRNHFGRRSSALPTLLCLLFGFFVGGCPKMKKRAEYNAMLWTAEVNENIERIFQGLANHHRRAKEKTAYRFPAAGPTPAHIPCGRKPHVPDSKLWRSPGWTGIGFSINEKFRYQYQVLSVGQGAGAKFTIRAHADLDCDGVYSTYERTGTIDATGKIKDGLLTWDKAKEIE